MARKKKNRTDLIVRNSAALANEAPYAGFIFKKHFDWLCEIRPDRKKEKLFLGKHDHGKIDEDGFVYVIVVNGKILKIGQTTTTFKGRLSSYNCGTRKFRRRGTASTTNYFVLQSLLAIGAPAQIYAYFAKKKRYLIFRGTSLPSRAPAHFPRRKSSGKKSTLNS